MAGGTIFGRILASVKCGVNFRASAAIPNGTSAVSIDSANALRAGTLPETPVQKIFGERRDGNTPPAVKDNANNACLETASAKTGCILDTFLLSTGPKNFNVI